MAEIVVSFVLDQLSIFLREEGSLLGGLRQEVELIRDELGHMRAFLRVAETKEEVADPRLQEWIKQVREAAYDTEDVLDEFVARFARHRTTGFYGSVRKIFNSIKNLRARHKLAKQIQSINTRVQKISERHQRYQSEFGVIDQPSGSLAAVNDTTWRYSRDDALLVEEADLVGIDKPKQQLISQLLEGDDSRLKVVSVVGMGGLGKTTLVKKVHEDLDVRKHFPVRAFVTVSQTCNFQQLLKDLIKQLHKDLEKPIPQSIESMTAIELKEFVKDFLQQAGRYAIVFDDVWDVEFWNAIRFALPENGYGNRVMLTTRKVDVASGSCIKSQDHVYKMVALSFEDSWTLFCNKVFKGNICPAHLLDVAKGILSKCEGLPLAILTIGGLLALKDLNIIGDWEMVRRSLGSELEGFGMLDRVRKIISLSYNDLSWHLKTCLLYLSIYPEDLEISAHRVVLLWVNERFVEMREGMHVQDVGWAYFRELVNRSLIQVTVEIHEGVPNYCRIHDLVREVILSKSREQNMITITTGQHTRWPSEKHKVRRLVVHGSSSNNMQHYQETQYYCFDHLRSFITIGSVNPLVSKNLLPEVLRRGRLLNVLDLRGKETLEEIPNKIFDLYHLRYLNLRTTGIKAVPKSIGKLKNLEYLNLGATQVRELPVEILKLQKLERLIVFQRVKPSEPQCGYLGFTAPSRLGGLFALRTLFCIDVSSGSIIVKEIRNLTQLGNLGISSLRREDGKELCSCLANLTRLRDLTICSIRKDDDGDYEVIDLNHHHYLSSSMSSSFLQSLRLLDLCGRLEKMPQWIAQLQSLVRIDLNWSGLRDEEDPLESLHHLPNLDVIKLCGSYRGEGLCFKAGGFLKLKYLNLRKLEKLRWMKVEEGALPNLQELRLERLPLLEELPLGIQHLIHLLKLCLYELSSQLTEKIENLNEESEDRRTIAHIPEIVIGSCTSEGWRYHSLSSKKM